MGACLLTVLACRNAVPREKPYKLSDANGLYLHVLPSGTRSWRWKYRIGGVEKKLSFGQFPEVSLAKARELRDEARSTLRAGGDPGAKTAPPEARPSFEQVARDWHKHQSLVRAPRYAGQILDRLETDVFPSIGAMPLADITAATVLKVIRSIEARDALVMAQRVRQHISSIFVFAIGAGLAETDPANLIQPALKPRTRTLRPAVLRIEDARALITAVEATTDAYVGTKLASRLLALTAVRPGVLRLAEPTEFEDLDGPAPLWRIPAGKMKLSRESKADAAYQFVVPLARQAVDVVKTAAVVSDGRPYLFPNTVKATKPISDSTLSKIYRDAGYQGRHVPHGWRATFSTIMNEMAAQNDNVLDRAIIDLMLAHMRGDVEAAYNRAAYMPRRRELAQIWADMLLKDAPPAGSLLPLD
ncbi:tyrosine-type recombinase/integrase [Sphingobium sp. B11D3A]|uniref:tyrosine-type recombinase/integrase n=1 Tax=Sphingobium sp. B11D3A TaxID=2940574 RepID=UPI0022247931|nr:integrase arm-type DNA-binding domain-containing protein [Sphingobium sp. B11D3A]